MSKIIIGLHGLGNKPPKSLLERWWKSALQEGLKLIGHRSKRFNFELVYWADILHPHPLNPEEADHNHPLYLSDPYIKSHGRIEKETPAVKDRIFEYIERQLDKLILSEDFSKITDVIVRHYFRDLDLYYTTRHTERENSEVYAKSIIRDRLEKILKKHSGKKILLLAHSMGSIIAYDVLARPAPEIKINTFITIGSPLGIPFILNRTKKELGLIHSQDISLATPSSVDRKWVNFSDPEDKIAMGFKLSEKYRENDKGIKPEDFIVYNDYENMGKRNPHKSYGYLRTNELSERIYEFLNEGRPKPIIWLTEKLDNIYNKITKDNI